MTNSFDDILNEVMYFESQRNGDFYNDYSLENLLKEFLGRYAFSHHLFYSKVMKEYRIYKQEYGDSIFTTYEDHNLKELLIWFLKDNYNEQSNINYK